MKKLTLIALVLFLGVSKMNAQKNVVKFNPLAVLFGSFQFGYERVVTTNSTIQVNVKYRSFTVEDPILVNAEEYKYSGFGGGLQYRLYLGASSEAPTGFFIGPSASFSSSKSSQGFKTSRGAVGGLLGYQWNFNPVTFDIYGGPGYYFVESDREDFDIPGFEGVGPLLGFSVGVAF